MGTNLHSVICNDAQRVVAAGQSAVSTATIHLQNTPLIHSHHVLCVTQCLCCRYEAAAIASVSDFANLFCAMKNTFDSVHMGAHVCLADL